MITLNEFYGFLIPENPDKYYRYYEDSRHYAKIRGIVEDNVFHVLENDPFTLRHYARRNVRDYVCTCTTHFKENSLKGAQYARTGR